MSQKIYHPVPTAILVDGAFFLKRYKRCFEGGKDHDPEVVADNMHKYLLKHLDDFSDLYRIFYYDSKPLDLRTHNPIDGKSIDFSKSNIYKFRTTLFDELKKHRKVALRLGYLKSHGDWQIHTP